MNATTKNKIGTRIENELRANTLEVLEKTRDIRDLLEVQDLVLREYLYEFGIVNPRLSRYILRSIATVNVLFSSIDAIKNVRVRKEIGNSIADIVCESYSLLVHYSRSQDEREIERAMKKLRSILNKAEGIIL